MGISRSNINEMLLGKKRHAKNYTFKYLDNTYVYTLKSNIEYTSNPRNPIKCIQTGDIFPSIYLASKYTGLSSSGISNSMKEDRTIRGLRFVSISLDEYNSCMDMSVAGII